MDAVYNYIFKLSLGLICFYLFYAIFLGHSGRGKSQKAGLSNTIDFKMKIDAVELRMREVEDCLNCDHNISVDATDKIGALFSYVVYQNLFVTESNRYRENDFTE
jgi:hypothetical protein